jgi:hypothetical protein
MIITSRPLYVVVRIKGDHVKNFTWTEHVASDTFASYRDLSISLKTAQSQGQHTQCLYEFQGWQGSGISLSSGVTKPSLGDHLLRTKELGKRSLMGKEGISSDTNIFYGNQH